MTTARTLRMVVGVEVAGEAPRSHQIAATRRDDGDWGLEVHGAAPEARRMIVPGDCPLWGMFVEGAA